jgi:TetR/AcrR family transcriptional regulator
VSNERRILDVAIGEFAAKGLAGARVAEIADRAGVNKQLLYYYYGSKAGLFGAAQGDMVATARRLIVDPKAGNFRKLMLAAVQPGAIARRRTLRRLWMWEALERDGEPIIREQERREAWARSVELVRHAQEAGEVDRRFRPEMVMVAVDAIINTPYMMPQVTKLITGMDPDTKAFRDRLRTFLAQVLTALEPEGGADATDAVGDELP